MIITYLTKQTILYLLLIRFYHLKFFHGKFYFHNQTYIWWNRWVVIIPYLCKTQNSGLCSKEEKPRNPINQPSRCNTQEGLLSVAQTGDSDLGGRAHGTANWASFLYAKNHTISILHTGYKVIGYMFTKQSYWYKLRGLLFKLKAILLVQTARAFVQT